MYAAFISGKNSLKLDSGRICSTVLTFEGLVGDPGVMASTREFSRVQVVVARIFLISSVNGSVDELPHKVPEQTVVNIAVTVGVGVVVMVAVAVVVVGVVTVVAGVIGVGGTIVDPPRSEICFCIPSNSSTALLYSMVLSSMITSWSRAASSAARTVESIVFERVLTSLAVQAVSKPSPFTVCKVVTKKESASVALNFRMSLIASKKRFSS